MSALFKKHWGKLAMVVLLALGLWIYHANGGEFSREDIVEYGKGMSPVWFVASFLILPLFGFPISILLVLAGVKFGLWGGMGLAAAGILLHNMLAYHLVHRWFHARFKNWLEKSGHSIPDMKGQNQVWFTALFATIHGPPYALKLYLLALTDVPFMIYFWVGAPIYILFCLIPVGAGSAVMHVNTWLLYGIVFGVTALALAGKWISSKKAK